MKIDRFKQAPGHLMEKAKEQIAAVVEEGNVEPLAPKVQRAGTARLLAESLNALPIVRQMMLAPERVRIREGYERAEDEYSDAEFQQLVASIREIGGNIDPVDVRLLDGVPGYEAELLAGTRRLRACQVAGVKVTANVRRCDNRTADMIHETENKHRKNKAPYSRGLYYKARLASGDYQNLSDLAANIHTAVSEVSRLVSLIDDAPKGMWEKVTDPGQINTVQARQLVAAYAKPAFQSAVAKAETLTAKELLKLAVAAMKVRDEKKKTEQARLARRGADYVILLPTGLSETVAKGAMEAARAFIEAEKG